MSGNYQVILKKMVLGLSTTNHLSFSISNIVVSSLLISSLCYPVAKSSLFVKFKLIKHHNMYKYYIEILVFLIV